MTVQILLALLLNTNPAQAQTQMSLPGIPVCEFIFEILPPANDDKEANYIAATGVDISAVYRYERIEVYGKNPIDLTEDQLRYEFMPGDGINVRDMAFTKDNKYLIVYADNATQIYRLGIEPVLAFESTYDEPHFYHYDAQNERIVIQAGPYLRAHDLRKHETLMFMGVRGNRSLARSISNNKEEFFNMIYIQDDVDQGRFLIEKNDEKKGKMIGVLSTSFAEIRWYKERNLMMLLKKEDTSENRSALMMRTIQMGLLESLRYLSRNPGASLAP